MKKILAFTVLAFSLSAQAKQSMDSVREDLLILIPQHETECRAQVEQITSETTCASLRETVELCHVTAIDQDGNPIDVAEVTECIGAK
jgi:phosphoenolpyruvate carboxylase